MTNHREIGDKEHKLIDIALYSRQIGRWSFSTRMFSTRREHAANRVTSSLNRDKLRPYEFPAS
jgi:hypothetical protein